jgi:hypothetical protein
MAIRTKEHNFDVGSLAGDVVYRFCRVRKGAPLDGTRRMVVKKDCATMCISTIPIKRASVQSELPPVEMQGAAIRFTGSVIFCFVLIKRSFSDGNFCFVICFVCKSQRSHPNCTAIVSLVVSELATGQRQGLGSSVHSNSPTKTAIIVVHHAVLELTGSASEASTIDENSSSSSNSEWNRSARKRDGIHHQARPSINSEETVGCSSGVEASPFALDGDLCVFSDNDLRIELF